MQRLPNVELSDSSRNGRRSKILYDDDRAARLNSVIRIPHQRVGTIGACWRSIEIRMQVARRVLVKNGITRYDKIHLSG